MRNDLRGAFLGKVHNQIIFPVLAYEHRPDGWLKDRPGKGVPRNIRMVKAIRQNISSGYLVDIKDDGCTRRPSGTRSISSLSSATTYEIPLRGVEIYPGNSSFITITPSEIPLRGVEIYPGSSSFMKTPRCETLFQLQRFILATAVL